MGLDIFLSRRRWIAHIYVFLTVTFGWIVFRISELRNATLFLKRMVVPWRYMSCDISPWIYMSGLTFLFLYVQSLDWDQYNILHRIELESDGDFLIWNGSGAR